MAPQPTSTAVPHTQPADDNSHDFPERIPRAVLVCRRAYSAADRATLCCTGHGIRFMTKALWLVRQLPLEKYGEWRTERRGKGLSGAEKAELVFFTRLWRFMQVEVEMRIEDDESELWECYEDVIEELARCGWSMWEEWRG